MKPQLSTMHKLTASYYSYLYTFYGIIRSVIELTQMNNVMNRLCTAIGAELKLKLQWKLATVNMPVHL